MKILTIVIPMYNVQEYIEQCLQSFVIPEIMNKIEVLVIDDGFIRRMVVMDQQLI